MICRRAPGATLLWCVGGGGVSVSVSVIVRVSVRDTVNLARSVAGPPSTMLVLTRVRVKVKVRVISVRVSMRHKVKVNLARSVAGPSRPNVGAFIPNFVLHHPVNRSVHCVGGGG